VILFGTAGPGEPWRWVAAVGLILLAGAGVVVGLRQPKSRALFVIVIVAAVAAVLLFAVSGQSLT
jgi:hypothetical protein